ncbi:MAG: hypothetical protein FWF69_03990 [Firmicutes bacterium]|nr:hypothetical protein [Bacillota bacterium]
MALLLLPMAAAAAPLVVSKEPSAFAAALDLFAHHTRGRGQGVAIGAWYLHPMGFGFVIPEGFSVKRQPSEKTILLVEETPGDTLFRSSISIVITEPDTRLAAMTLQSVKADYKREFSRFELIDLAHQTMGDTPVTYISFYSGSAPRLFIRQCIFVRDGHSFIITLTTKKSVKTLPDALSKYEALCASLVFLEDP